MIDLTTKLLLGIIALGLWANVGLQFRPLAAVTEHMSQLGYLSPIARSIVEIEQNIESIEKGRCRNSKLC